MKILVVTPLLRDVNGKVRLFARALSSVYNVRWGWQLDHYQASGGDNYRDPAGTVTRKYQEAQAVFLAGTWDAMLCVEHDMIIPPDALERLTAVEADIAYGLYVMRHDQRWSAALRVWERSWLSYSNQPPKARAAWNQVIDVQGIGQGCTLIKRHVLEAAPFRHLKGTSCDWSLALDAKTHGFTQRADCGLICGHMTIVPSPLVYWPDANEETLYRIEALA